MGIIKAFTENVITRGFLLSALFTQKKQVEEKIESCDRILSKLDNMLLLIEEAERRN